MNSREYIFSSVEIQITNRCNCMCKNCIRYSGPYRTDIISETVIQEVIRKVGNKTNKIIISGGEPTFYMDIIREISFLFNKSETNNQYQKDICLCTNGYWAENDKKTEKMLYKLKSFGINEIRLPDSDKFHAEFIEENKINRIMEVNHENKIIDSINKKTGISQTDNKDFFCYMMKENNIIVNVYGDIQLCEMPYVCYMGSIQEDTCMDIFGYEFVGILKNGGIKELINQYNLKFDEKIEYNAGRNMCQICHMVTSEWKRRSKIRY